MIPASVGWWGVAGGLVAAQVSLLLLRVAAVIQVSWWVVFVPVELVLAFLIAAIGSILIEGAMDGNPFQ
jgi:hypothetical protein